MIIVLMVLAGMCYTAGVYLKRYWKLRLAVLYLFGLGLVVQSAACFLGIRHEQEFYRAVVWRMGVLTYMILWFHFMWALLTYGLNKLSWRRRFRWWNLRVWYFWLLTVCLGAFTLNWLLGLLSLLAWLIGLALWVLTGIGQRIAWDMSGHREPIPPPVEREGLL